MSDPNPAPGQAVDPVLLWRAFPDGYLAVRGVFTLDWWTCCSVDEETSFWACPWKTAEPLGNFPKQLIGKGDFLPEYRDPLTRYAIWTVLGRLLLPDLPDSFTIVVEPRFSAPYGEHLIGWKCCAGLGTTGASAQWTDFGDSITSEPIAVLTAIAEKRASRSTP